MLDDGVVSEAFVARLDYAGRVQWTVPLLDAGAPRDVGVSATGEVVVVAPYMPDVGMLSSSSSSDDLYLVKLDSAGTILFERVLTFDLDQDGTTVYGMDVALDGSITIAGMYFSAGGQHPLPADTPSTTPTAASCGSPAGKVIYLSLAAAGQLGEYDYPPLIVAFDVSVD